MSLRDNLRLSYVPRWVIVPMLRQQTVSDHCWRVAMITRALMTRIDCPSVYVAVCEAVTHDLDEIWTGDHPSTTKTLPDLRSKRAIDLVVKAADYIEQISWAKAWAHPSALPAILAHTEPRYTAVADELATRYGSDVLVYLEEIRRELEQNDRFVPTVP